MPVTDMQPWHARLASGVPHAAHALRSFRSSTALAWPCAAAAIM